jgi:membrane-associated HD superfamily phosphohydrolase
VRAICERRDARWLPSRHRYALFRLFALLRLRTAKPEIQPGVLLMLDRDQSQAEYYSVSAWVLLMLTCFLAASMFPTWNVALAVLTALPLALLVVSLGIVLAALTAGPLWSAVSGVKGANQVGIVSFALMSLFLATAAYHTMSRTWIRWVAWQVLCVVALNALAAVLLYFLRGEIARLEAAYDDTGGLPSVS